MSNSSSLALGLMTRLNHVRLYRVSGFTLIELMVTVVIVSILVAIAYPSYAQYMERRDLSVAKQEALRISAELEKFKSKNFSYKGFDPTFIYPTYDNITGELYIPAGSTTTNAKYLLTLVDFDVKKPLTIARDSDGKETARSESVKGLSWAIKVIPKDLRNNAILLTSTGIACEIKATESLTNLNNYKNCEGENGE